MINTYVASLTVAICFVFALYGLIAFMVYGIFTYEYFENLTTISSRFLDIPNLSVNSLQITTNLRKNLGKY